MIEFFDEKEIIDPSSTAHGVAETIKESGVTTAVSAFSSHIFDAIISGYGGEHIATITGGNDIKLYRISYNGKNMVAYRSTVGAPAAVSAAEEALACGIKNLVTFGICGALIDVPPRTFVVPTRAFRDEGTSYHYAPPAEFIGLSGSGLVARKLQSYGLNTIAGGAWCTDGFYRETRTRCDEVKRKGCIAVDMECSALQAMCNFRQKNFYTFFITADSLAGENWEPNYILDIKAEAADMIGVAAAVRFASELE